VCAPQKNDEATILTSKLVLIDAIKQAADAEVILPVQENGNHHRFLNTLTAACFFHHHKQHNLLHLEKSMG
jgi:hypothetical protein